MSRKLLFAILIVSFFISCTTQQIYLDENGKEISEEEFQQKWRNKNLDFTRWDAREGNKRVAKLSGPTYEQYVISYGPFLKNLESITAQKFNDSTIFMIKFYHLDDVCSSKWSNTWNRSTIKERKQFLQPRIDKLEQDYKEVKFLQFFEDGYNLKKPMASENEYFFTDTSDFLKKTLFRNPTLCGSFALVKPNGQVLVRNGEHTIPLMARHLDKENWNLLFPAEE